MHVISPWEVTSRSTTATLKWFRDQKNKMKTLVFKSPLKSFLYIKGLQRLHSSACSLPHWSPRFPRPLTTRPWGPIAKWQVGRSRGRKWGMKDWKAPFLVQGPLTRALRMTQRGGRTSMFRTYKRTLFLIDDADLKLVLLTLNVF